MEDRVLLQVQHQVLTTRNTIKASALIVRRKGLAHIDEEDERQLTLQIRAAAQEIRIQK